MKSTQFLCKAVLTIAVMATSIGCSDDNANTPTNGDNNYDVPSYMVDQKCPEHITYDGICDGNKVVFCNQSGVVEEIVCPTQCMVKQSYTIPFAECYNECGDIDFRGKCVSGGYDYCNETEGLIHITCDSEQTCTLKDDVFACI